MIVEIMEKNEELWNKFMVFYAYYTTIAVIMLFIIPELGAWLCFIWWASLFLDGILSVISGLVYGDTK